MQSGSGLVQQIIAINIDDIACAPTVSRTAVAKRTQRMKCTVPLSSLPT